MERLKLESPSILKRDWNSINDYLIALFKFLFKRQISNFYIIYGRRGSGKTDLALFILEILHDFDIVQHFATNIKIYESPFPIEDISDLQSLTDWASSKRGKKVYILDEAGRAFKRRKPMSKINVEIIDKLQIIRKFKLSLIWSTPSEAFLDKVAHNPELLDGNFKKIIYNNPERAYYRDLLEKFSIPIYAIPPTLIRYDTWDSAPFTLKQKDAKPFKDHDRNIFWAYATGEMKISETGMHPQEFRRKLKKFLVETLKEESRVT